MPQLIPILWRGGPTVPWLHVVLHWWLFHVCVHSFCTLELCALVCAFGRGKCLTPFVRRCSKWQAQNAKYRRSDHRSDKNGLRFSRIYVSIVFVALHVPLCRCERTGCQSVAIPLCNYVIVHMPGNQMQITVPDNYPSLIYRGFTQKRKASMIWQYGSKEKRDQNTAAAITRDVVG